MPLQEWLVAIDVISKRDYRLACEWRVHEGQILQGCQILQLRQVAFSAQQIPSQVEGRADICEVVTNMTRKKNSDRGVYDCIEPYN